MRIVRNASNAKGDRNAYAKLPYRPPCKLVPGPASKPPVSDADPTNGQPALAAGNSVMVPAIRQIEAQCEKQVLSDSEQLITKYNTYASFKVDVTCNDMSTFLHPDKWPQGVYLRKFFNNKK